MTPDDILENTRDLVFEILKRKHPETMPRKDTSLVLVRDDVAKICLYLTTWMPTTSKQCLAINAMYPTRSGRLQNRAVVLLDEACEIKEIRWKEVHEAVDEMVYFCKVNDYTSIADELGMMPTPKET